MIYCISTVREDKYKIKGYKLFDTDSHECLVLPIDKAMACDEIGVCNAHYDAEFKGLVSSCDKSIDSLPKLTEYGCIDGRGGVGICSMITRNGEYIGCEVFDANGAVSAVSLDKLKVLISKFSTINFEMKNTENGFLPSPLCGEKWTVRKMESTPDYKSSAYWGTKGESAVSPMAVPKVPLYNLDTADIDVFNQDAQTKVTMALVWLKIISPYYWVLLNTVSRIINNAIPTMSASEDTIHYNTEFVSQRKESVLVFIFIHELDHICMRHSIRQGKRDHNLWNIACDIYINELICNEFELTPGEEKTFTSGGHSGTICAPTDGYYISKIGETLDLGRDTPETIYAKLESENNSSGGQGGEGQSSDSQSGGGNSSGESQGGNNDTQSDGGSDSGDGQDSESSSNGTNECTVTYNGKKLTGKSFDDIMSNEGIDENSSEEDIAKAMEDSKKQLQRMDTKKKMVEQKTGEELTKSSTVAQLIQRYIEIGLSNSVDWRIVLKNMCKVKPKKMYNMSTPNIDYMNNGMSIAGRSKTGVKKAYRGIKICIDVSGSISDDMLKWYLSEVANIFQKHDVTGELIYWSTEVGDSGDFKSVHDLVKVNPKSTGGTDVKCLFDYLAGSGKTMTGKKCDTKPKDIIGVIILTDGQFDRNYGMYERAFGRKTLWLIDGNVTTFSPCFGKALPISMKNLKEVI